MPAYQPPTAPLQIALLGCAHTGHAASYLSALQKIPGVHLAAIYDDDSRRGRSFANQFQAPFYTDVFELLAKEDLQAVLVCAQTADHRDLIVAAAQHGLPVLCEKPLAATLADAHEIIAACRNAGVLLQTALVSRFYPMVQTARGLVQSGESGRVLGITGGNRGIPPLPPAYPDWITDPQLAGGGALIDHSVHVTDAMRFILGKEVESVFAHTGTLFQPDLKVEDSALLSLAFTEGIIASVDSSWSLPTNNPYHYDFYLRFLTENGTIDLDDTRQALTIISNVPQERAVAAEPFGLDIDLAMLAHFIACVQAGKNLFPAASGEDGLRALEIALAGYQSIKEGKAICIMAESEKK